jgi:hypothetical protein
MWLTFRLRAPLCWIIPSRQFPRAQVKLIPHCALREILIVIFISSDVRVKCECLKNEGAMHVPAPKPATAVAMCACLSDDLRRENNNNITPKQGFSEPSECLAAQHLCALCDLEQLCILAFSRTWMSGILWIVRCGGDRDDSPNQAPCARRCTYQSQRR